MIRFVLLLVALTLPSVAAAQRAPRSIDDCEKLNEPLAYNACLASFGPSPGQRPAAGSVEEAQDPEPRYSRSRGAQSRQRAAPPGYPVPQGALDTGRRANGRQFLVIEPNRRR